MAVREAAWSLLHLWTGRDETVSRGEGQVVGGPRPRNWSYSRAIMQRLQHRYRYVRRFRPFVEEGNRVSDFLLQLPS